MIDKNNKVKEAIKQLEAEVEASMSLLEDDGAKQFVEHLKESLSRSKEIAIANGANKEEVDKIARPLEEKFASFFTEEENGSKTEGDRILSQDEVDKLLELITSSDVGQEEAAEIIVGADELKEEEPETTDNVSDSKSELPEFEPIDESEVPVDTGTDEDTQTEAEEDVGMADEQTSEPEDEETERQSADEITREALENAGENEDVEDTQTTTEATENQEEQPGRFTRIFQSILNISWIAGAKNWFKTGPKKVTIPVAVFSALIIFVGGYHYVVSPIISGVSGIFSLFEEKEELETIEVNVKKYVNNTIIDPITVDGRAGEYVEFHHDENSCFYITGNNKSGSYEPSSKKAHLAFRAPDGKEYRLADYITSYRFPADGQLKMFVRNTEEETMIWTGASKNCAAERRSDFQDGPIYITVKRLKEGEMESDDAEYAKLIEEEEVFSAEKLKEKYDEQDEKVEEAATLVREKASNLWNYLFNRPLTVKTKLKE